MKLYRRKNGYYYIRYKRGKEKSLRTKDKRLAERLFKEFQKRYIEKKLTSIESYQNISLKDFFYDVYIKWAENHKSLYTVDRDKFAFKSFLEFTGNRYIRSVNERLIEDYQNYLINKGRKTTGINLDFRHLKSAFNKAVQWGYIKSNPFKNINFLKVPSQLPKFISVAEMNKILDFLKKNDPDFHDFIFVALETGCRRSELAYLNFEDVDIENSFMRVKGKGNRERIIPLTQNVKAILGKHVNRKKSNNSRVFHKWSPGWISKKWSLLMKKLGLKYRFHDLRHTNASWMAIHGVPIQFIQELLGHSSVNVTKIYAHLNPDCLKSALEDVFSQKVKYPHLKPVK